MPTKLHSVEHLKGADRTMIDKSHYVELNNRFKIFKLVTCRITYQDNLDSLI